MSLESNRIHLSLPTRNLRSYISNAVLPDYPTSFPITGGSQNQRRYDLLSTEPDIHRKLVRMNCYARHWQLRVAKFCEEEIPSSAIRKPKSADKSKQRPRIAIPSPSFCIERFRWPADLNEVESINEATRGVLCTAERIVSLLWPVRSQGYKFTDTPYSTPVSLSSPDLAIAAFSYYGRYGHDEGSSIQDRTGVVIISMPCWVLSDNEIKKFADCRTLPQFEDTSSGRELLSFNKHQKIWAKARISSIVYDLWNGTETERIQLWDLCATRSCSLFILTNYHSWVFGAFQTPGFSRGKCSQVIDRRHQSESGSVLKWAVFWFAAVMNIRGTGMFARSIASNIPDIRNKGRLAPLDFHKLYTDKDHRFHEDVEWLKRIRSIDTIKNDVTLPLHNHPEAWITKFVH